MNRIIRALRAIGQRAKAEPATVKRHYIPRGGDALELAKANAGTWVKDSDMTPWVNVADRVYRKHDGTFGIFYAHDGIRMDSVEAWFFPSVN